jgi:hypothetical protein
VKEVNVEIKSRRTLDELIELGHCVLGLVVLPIKTDDTGSEHGPVLSNKAIQTLDVIANCLVAIQGESGTFNSIIAAVVVAEKIPFLEKFADIFSNEMRSAGFIRTEDDRAVDVCDSRRRSGRFNGRRRHRNLTVD